MKILVLCHRTLFLTGDLYWEYVALAFKRRLFSMFCNLCSKLIPTDHIYIHKYRNLLMFLNPHMYLKSLLIV